MEVKNRKILTGDATENYMPNARNGLSEKQQTQATNKGREELQKKKKNLWYEIIQALD